MGFSGRVIAITGAGSGIGRALALELADRGADLALADIDEAGLTDTAAGVAARGRRASHHRVDVADRGAVFAWAEDVVADHGRVDGIVNNAGVSVSNTLADLSFEDLDWIVGVNLWGVIHGTKAFLPRLLAQDDGWIVNLSSVFGLVAAPSQSAYNLTKFAVRGMTESLRQELAHTGVAVSCVHPGGIKTNLIRNSRFYVGNDGTRDRGRFERRFDKIARTSTEQAGRAIADGMERRSPRILIGPDAVVIDAIARAAPVRYPQLMETAFDRLPRAASRRR